jgi:hypothetical protein
MMRIVNSLLLTAVGLWLVAGIPAIGQNPPYRAPRAADGHPDLNGIWEALNAAKWDLEDHSPAPGTMWQLGAIAAQPAGMTVVDGGPIPYRPEALAKKKEDFANRRTNDPEAKCYMPGIPRANYMPYPFQIVQSPQGILVCLRICVRQSLRQHGETGRSGLRHMDGHQ